MATIYREVDLDAHADEAWRRLADVGAVDKLIDYLGPVTVDGDRRSCSLGDQGELNELIVTVDHDRRRLAYSIRESPLKFTHHSASWQVTPEGDKSRLVWITDVKPDSAAALEALIDQTADSIQRNLSR
jgi:hypothetical protein